MRWAAAALTLVAAVAVLALASVARAALFQPDAGGRAPTVAVRDTAEFARAVELLRATGGTIVLRPGRYPELDVGARGSRWLTIRALPGASAAIVDLAWTRNVDVIGLRITPRSRDADLTIEQSHRIRIEQVAVTGGRSRRAAGIDLRNSTHVLIRSSTFSRCGDRHLCIIIGHSSDLKIIGNRFHDCFGCDFIRGRFGRNLLIDGNSFQRSLRGPCGTDPKRCNHQDLIEIQEGRGLVVEKNVFGVAQLPGGGQLSLFGPIDSVRIVNNLFLGADPLVPRIHPIVAINLGGRLGLPRKAVIANNTILSGAKRPDRYFATSIRFKTTFALVPRAQRPVLANNVIALAATPGVLCRVARLSVTNVIVKGVPCSSTDVVGDPRITEHGCPTSESTLVIDRAASEWAPSDDLLGVPRDSHPDIGAYEYTDEAAAACGTSRSNLSFAKTRPGDLATLLFADPRLWAFLHAAW